MEYKIVVKEHISYTFALSELEEEVNDLLAKGWTLQGGVATSKEYSNYFVASQAMIKQNSERKNDIKPEASINMM